MVLVGITAFRRRALKPCARRWRAANAKAEIIVYPDAEKMHSTPIIVARAIMPNLRKMAGGVCWSGLSSMVGSGISFL